MRHFVVDPQKDITAYELATLLCTVQAPGSTPELIRERLLEKCPSAIRHIPGWDWSKSELVEIEKNREILDSENANARLIAAAPDLLEALKRLERTVRILPPDMDEPDSPLAQARAAVSKATKE